MQKIAELMQAKAVELLQSGKAERVLAWQAGEFFYDNAPAAFNDAEACKNIVYNEFCPANLAKYLIEATKQQKKTVVFLKPCDTYGVNQLLKDNRIKREYFYAVGTPCAGMLDIDKIKANGIKGITGISCDGDNVIVNTVYGTKELPKVSVLLDKCMRCKGNEYKIADEEIGSQMEVVQFIGDKFAAVKEIEAMNITDIEAVYRIQCYEDEKLELIMRKEENTVDIGILKEDGKTAAVVRFVCNR
jgi:hypothetical protein